MNKSRTLSNLNGKKIKNKYLLILILLPLILKLILAFIIPGHMTGIDIKEYDTNPPNYGDLDIFKWTTNSLMDGKNPFSDQRIYPHLRGYGPLFFLLSLINGVIISVTGLPFHFVTKIFPLLAETLITLVLFLILSKKYSLKKSFYWSLLFALNPVNLAVTTIHGQIDAIPILAIVLSYYFFMSNNRKIRNILPAVCLGIGASFKYFPLLLLPILFFKYKDIREKLSFVVITLTSLLITYLPFIISGDFFTSITDSLAYTPTFNWGIAKFFLLFHRLNIPSSFILLIENFLMEYGKFFLAIALIITVLIYSKVKDLGKSYRVIFYCIYVFTFFMCTNYLAWIIPFLFLKADLRNIHYVVLATGHIYFLYIIELVGVGIYKIGTNTLFQPISFIFGVFTWLFCLYMYFIYIKKDIKNIQFKRIFSISYWLEQNKED